MIFNFSFTFFSINSILLLNKIQLKIIIQKWETEKKNKNI